jgi:uncharacterized membrane protein
MKHLQHASLILSVALLGAMYTSASSQPIGCMTFPPPAGVSHSGVAALSSDGRSATGFYMGEYIYAFTWNIDSGYCHQAPGAGLEYSYIPGISADGTTITGFVMPDHSQVNEGYAWHGQACGDMRTPGLDWLPGPRNFITKGLSGDGLTVYGTISDTGVTGAVGAFLWRPGTGEVIELDLMPQYWGEWISFLGSMNTDYAGDTFAGTLVDTEFFPRAAVWDRHGTGRLLPIAAGVALNSTYADGISRNGRYIAGEHRASGTGYAAIWKDEQPPELVLLGSPAQSSNMTLIADHGRMGIGWHGQQIVAWTRENGPENLVTYLARHGAPLPEGWNVQGVRSISSDGSVIAGVLRRSPTQYLGFIAYTNYQPCFADFNNDGGVDGRDVEDFFLAWESGDIDGDINQDGGTDGGDVERFFIDWEAGGCGDS